MFWQLYLFYRYYGEITYPHFSSEEINRIRSTSFWRSGLLNLSDEELMNYWKLLKEEDWCRLPWCGDNFCKNVCPYIEGAAPSEKKYLPKPLMDSYNEDIVRHLSAGHMDEIQFVESLRFNSENDFVDMPWCLEGFLDTCCPPQHTIC